MFKGALLIKTEQWTILSKKLYLQTVQTKFDGNDFRFCGLLSPIDAAQKVIKMIVLCKCISFENASSQVLEHKDWLTHYVQWAFQVNMEL